MKKLFSLAVSVLLLVGGMLFQHAAFAENATPDARTKAFYTWYIKLQSKDGIEVYPLLDKGIYAYVAKATVDKLRDAYRHSRLPGDGDYFTKVQDYDERDWANNIVTRPPLMLSDLAIVPVTFGSKDHLSVLVFLRKQGGAWKITKVEDTLDYYE
jgi:Protein of unknown function (DUF3828)